MINHYEISIFEKLPDKVLRPGGILLTKRIIDYCAFSRGARVVDIGCGTGVTVEYLRNCCGLDAIGIDLSERRLQKGRDRSPNLPIFQASAEDLPFAAASVEGVLAECSLSTMEDAGKILSEVSRVLISGGKLAITDMFIRDSGSTLLQDEIESAGYMQGIIPYDELRKLVSSKGFELLIWEDNSPYLKEIVAQVIMEYGSDEMLWKCISFRNSCQRTSHSNIKRNMLGYFLLVAQKCINASPES